jgi:hypothetical protein
VRSHRRVLSLLGAIGFVAVGRFAPAVAQAQTQTSVQKVTDTFDNFVPCANGGNGEVIRITEQLLVVTHTTQTPKGTFLTDLKIIDQGTTGVGLTTSAVYHRVGLTAIHDLFTASAGEVHTYNNIYNVIGPAQVGTMLIHDLVHVTINANGTVTASVDQHSFECK